MTPEFSRWAKVHTLTNYKSQGGKAIALAEEFIEAGHTIAIVNTTVSGLFLETLTQAGLRCIALVHELPGIIYAYKLEACAAAIAKNAHKIIFPSTCVENEFSQFNVYQI